MKKFSIPVETIILIAVLFVIACILFVSFGSSEKMNFLVGQNLDSQIAEGESKIEEIESDIATLEAEIAGLDEKIGADEELYNAYINYYSQEMQYKQTIETNTSKLDSLTAEVTTKQNELQRLTTGTVVTGDPITLGAGEHTVGKSIPAGRYRITGSSNLFIYTDDGDLLVNTILGSRWGVSSYTVNIADGYMIEAHGKDTFLPVE